MANAYFKTGYCEPFYSFTYKKGNEPSRCALGANSGDKKLRDRIAPNTLLTINGDIPDRQTGLQLAEQYGIDGVMIGRGIFKNPFAFEKEPKEHSSKEYLDLLRLQLDLQDQYAEVLPRSITGLHRFFKIYVKGFPGAAELRNQLMNRNQQMKCVHCLITLEKNVDGARECKKM